MLVALVPLSLVILTSYYPARAALLLMVLGLGGSADAQHPARCPTVPRSLALPLPARSCTLDCGRDRWPVKTLSDRDVSRINFTPRRSTVRALARLRPPTARPADRRTSVAERRVYCIEALITEIPRPQEDGDLHVILSDPVDPENTIIAELPDPRCPAVCASPLAAALGSARRKLERQLATWSTDTLRVVIVGVGFFDRNHGQLGAAPNFFELHPVLAVVFP